jgi:hypothetical protein
MESQATFLDCPAYLDKQGLVRCGLPAEAKRRFIMSSTDGPLESAMIWCPAGHFFNGPIKFLSLENHGATARGRPSAGPAATSAAADNRTAHPLTMTSRRG